ncbi:MAG: Maf family protein [Kiritimatiellae bacterium]|nr:Maf family protein [Kiritimatiellia bacterium]
MPPAPAGEIELVLASASPRRRVLLRRAGYRPRVVVPTVDERPRRGESPADCAQRLALEKARAAADGLAAARRLRVVLACDTVVALGGCILGKPRDAAEARRMLRQLSGRSHSVITGVALIRQAPGQRPRRRVFAVETRVLFRRLSAAEIAAYVRSGDPMDKAGAYGIQEGAAHFVRAVCGSVTNVIGLPLAEVVVELQRLGVRPSPDIEGRA